MADFAQSLAGYLEGPVLDRTGLDGTFEFHLTFNPHELPLIARLRPPGAPPIVPPGLPSIFTAMTEQLGLTLEAQRVTVPVPVVEQVHPPTEN